MARKRGRPPFSDTLTPAEWRVVEAVRHGLSNPEIARRQKVSLDAVKYHVANALQKLGCSSRAELRRWDGVAASSALARKKLVLDGDFSLCSIGQISRTVKDVKASSAWYTKILGLKHLYSFAKIAFFDAGGIRIFLTESDAASAESIIYFRVDDVHTAHTKLSDRGVVFLNAPHMIHRHPDGTEEWMAFFKDNEERPLGIMSQVKR